MGLLEQENNDFVKYSTVNNCNNFINTIEIMILIRIQSLENTAKKYCIFFRFASIYKIFNVCDFVYDRHYFLKLFIIQGWRRETYWSSKTCRHKRLFERWQEACNKLKTKLEGEDWFQKPRTKTGYKDFTRVHSRH